MSVMNKKKLLLKGRPMADSVHPTLHAVIYLHKHHNPK